MTTDNGIVAFLTWSGVYDEPFSSDALAQQLTTLPRAYLLRGLSMIATVLVNSGGIPGRGQRDLAAEILVAS